jgi:DNA-binding NarL/FixJ family response regulator
LVEDHPVFRLGLKELVNQEDDLQVCGEADDVEGALEQIASTQPDLVLVDLSLKGESGIDLIKKLRALHEELPLLVVSMYDEALYAERALNAGARGYIMKQETSASIVEAARKVLEGKIFLSEHIMSDMLGKIVGGTAARPVTSMESLTDREREVFELIGNGFATREIADKLNLSTKTIGTYRERIKEKLDLKTAAELNRYAVKMSE